MTTLSRSLALSAMLAASASAQTARDSALLKQATTAKAATDSLSLLVAPPLAQWCRSYNSPGYMKNGPCLYFMRLLTRDTGSVATIARIASVPAKTDTVRITRVDTVYVVKDTVTPPPTPVAVASVSATLTPTSILVGQTAQASAVVKDSAGNTLARTVTWSSSAPTVASVTVSGLVSGLAAGTSQIKATVDTKSSYRTITVAAQPPPDTTPTPPPAVGEAELPRVLVNSSLFATTSTGRTLRVAVGGNLQAALDTMKQGDRVVLACDGDYEGQFLIHNYSSDPLWMHIESEGCASIAEGQRMTPSLATHLPKVRSTTNGPAFRFAQGAHHVRIQLLDIVCGPTAASNTWGLVSIGEGGETSTAQLPHHVVIDRDYLHCTSEVDIRRGIANNGATVAVINSWISGIHAVGDAQAISGWNGPGPYDYSNNYLEASGMAIGSGGAYVANTNVTPSDVVVRGNHMTKDLSTCGRWTCKNLFEVKHGSHWLIEGNVLEHSRPGGQDGWAVLLWSVNQNGDCPWCVTEHMTFRNNWTRDVTAGFQLSATYWQYTQVPMHHVTIRNNLTTGSQGGWLFQFAGVMPNLTIDHNTAFTPYQGWVWSADARLLPNFIVTNNVTGATSVTGTYPMFGDVQCGAVWPLVAGPGSRFTKNVVTNCLTALPADNVDNWRPTVEALLLAGGASKATDANASIDELCLAATSPWKGKGENGTDPGVNCATLKAAIAGAVVTP